MESGQSDIGDVVERGHNRVARQDPQIVPPLGVHCLPFKRKFRVVSLQLTSRKVVIDGNHVSPHGAVDEASGGVDGTEAGGNEPDGPQPWEGRLQLPKKVSGPTFFPNHPALSGVRMST